MNPQVTAALISGGVALVVALAGIAGTIVAQSIATKRAFQNSLALLERDRRAQEEERRTRTAREDAFRFAGERRATYVRYARIAEALLIAALEIYDAAVARPADDPDHRLRSLEIAATVWGRLREELDEVEQEVTLLAGSEVRGAAAGLYGAVCSPPNLADIPMPRHLVSSLPVKIRIQTSASMTIGVKPSSMLHDENWGFSRPAPRCYSGRGAKQPNQHGAVPERRKDGAAKQRSARRVS